MKLLLIGIQGSGKSTQGNLLSKKLGIPYISSGEIFRKIAQEESEWGNYIRGMLKEGHLIPDDKTIALMHDYLNKPEYEKGYIIDGFPRTMTQAKSFDGVEKVISINISDEEALKRITSRKEKEAREDDTADAVANRIALFHEHTEPLLAYYREKGMLEEVDGEKGIEDIHNDILTRLHI